MSVFLICIMATAYLYRKNTELYYCNRGHDLSEKENTFQIFFYCLDFCFTIYNFEKLQSAG
jgi:hypothetical protein